MFHRVNNKNSNDSVEAIRLEMDINGKTESKTNFTSCSQSSNLHRCIQRVIQK